MEREQRGVVGVGDEVGVVVVDVAGIDVVYAVGVVVVVEGVVGIDVDVAGIGIVLEVVVSSSWSK